MNRLFRGNGCDAVRNTRSPPGRIIMYRGARALDENFRDSFNEG